MPKLSLKAARVNAGLSQKKAAELLDVSNKTLWSWENGKSFPNADKIVSICNLYGVQYDHLDFLPKNSL